MSSISVIMPVYNVEPWLCECLDSVRAQTFTDWECICVDDGSTDDSPAILGKYASKDPRFKIYRREHTNAGAVRNFGMTKATGTYLAFLDSDDIFSPWMFETLLAKADETGADIAACSAIWFPDGTPVPSFTQPANLEWEDRTPDPNWTHRPLLAGTMPWNKIIRRQFVENLGIRFLEQSSTNDFTFMALAISLSGKTFHTQAPLLGYRQHAKSIQSGKSKNPLNFLLAMESYRAQMTTKGAWQKLSPQGIQIVFEAYAEMAVWELETQTSLSGYRTLYRGLRQLNADWRSMGASADRLDETKAKLLRYRAIVEGNFKERLKASCESVLAPFLGSRNRHTGLKALFSRKTQHFLWIVFDSPARPWNRIRR